jgi:hypothetical protein
MVLKVSTWKHIEKLWTLVFPFLLILYLLFIGGSELYILLTIVILGFTLIFPLLFIHLNHYRYSKRRVVELLDNMIKVEGENGVVIIDLEDISSITTYMSGVRYANLSLQTFPTEEYYYCKINTNGGESIYLSCLFSENIDELLKERFNVTFLKEKKYYPTINE